jgi:hypothetical protein
MTGPVICQLGRGSDSRVQVLLLAFQANMPTQPQMKPNLGVGTSMQAPLVWLSLEQGLLAHARGPVQGEYRVHARSTSLKSTTEGPSWT